MAYRNFKIEDLKTEFGIKIERKAIFKSITNLKVSDWLKTSLEYGLSLALISEKIRDEAIVYPILMEIRNRNRNLINIFSGKNLDADRKRKLNGECDFILSFGDEIDEISTPIFTILESKQENIEKYLGQIISQMIGSHIFNLKHNKNLNYIFGALTTGESWLFLKLNTKENIIYIDNQKFYINEVENILGVLQNIVDYYKNLKE